MSRRDWLIVLGVGLLLLLLWWLLRRKAPASTGGTTTAWTDTNAGAPEARNAGGSLTAVLFPRTGSTLI